MGPISCRGGPCDDDTETRTSGRVTVRLRDAGRSLGDEGLFKQLKKALLERALGAELSDHLGYEKGDPAGRGTGNSRNGHSGKTVLTEDGAVELAVPRDRNGSFEPAIVPKGERRLDGFDGRILSLYARGMTVREIQGHLQELYRVEVSPDLISRVRVSGVPQFSGNDRCVRSRSWIWLFSSTHSTSALSGGSR